MRRSGVLLPVSSLPSKYGIGTFSKEAYQFVDFLAKAGQSLWQILPLGPTGYGDSPYQSFSTFAGNPYFIDLETLIQEKLLSKRECEAFDFGSDLKRINYEKLYHARFEILRKAFGRFDVTGREYQKFCAENAVWLDDYALYMAVKNSFDGKEWTLWDEDIRLRKPEAMKKYQERYANEIEFYKFQQYEFAKQWFALKSYANAKKIKIVGDIPIYVAFDSADTWANPELFQLDEDLCPKGVAGCPPDAFSETGQLWGNPLYDWDYHKKTGFEWWIRRLGYCYKLYDIVRIDHFRGFDEYYSIPYGDDTAEFGHWEKGPGIALFKAIKKTLGEKEIIAEDLGFLTPSVLELVKQTGFPGMKVLQFAFDSREPSDYLPHNYNHNCVVYTGTHDNDTMMGWMKAARKADVKFACKYLGVPLVDGKIDKEALRLAMLRAALASTADTAVIPLQDYLALSGKARINTPSTLGGNWVWRLTPGQIPDGLAKDMKEMVRLYCR